MYSVITDTEFGLELPSIIKRDRYYTKYIFYAIGEIVSVIKLTFITK